MAQGGHQGQLLLLAEITHQGLQAAGLQGQAPGLILQQDLPQAHPKLVVRHQGEGRREVEPLAGIAGVLEGSQRPPSADRRAGHSPREGNPF